MPMDRRLYPPDWESLALRLKVAARWRCETCGKPKGECLVADQGLWFDVEKGHWRGRTGEVVDAPPTSVHREIVVVLTVAHLDHDPGNCVPENLRVLCQACHLRYDAKRHAANAKLNRARRAGQLDLLKEEKDP